MVPSNLTNVWRISHPRERSSLLACIGPRFCIGPQSLVWIFHKNCEIADVSLWIFFHFESAMKKIEKESCFRDKVVAGDQIGISYILFLLLSWRVTFSNPSLLFCVIYCQHQFKPLYSLTAKFTRLQWFCVEDFCPPGIQWAENINLDLNQWPKATR